MKKTKQLVVGKRYYFDATMMASGVFNGIKKELITFIQPLNSDQYMEEEDGSIKFDQYGKDMANEKNFPPYNP